MSHLAAVAKYGHPNRKPEPTRERLEPLMAKPPNWSRLVQCVEPAEDIYLMGRLYAANVVYEDIRSGLVKPSSFKPVQERN
jgi:hypothetical protein